MSLLCRKRCFYLLLPGLIMAAVLTLHIKTDLSAFFIAGDSGEEILLASEMQSGTLSRRYLLSIGTKTQNSVPLNFINDYMAALIQIDGVIDVWKPGQERVAAAAIQALYLQHSTQFYSLHPQVDLENMFSRQGLHQQAAALKQALLSPQGAMVKKIALQDPLLLSLHAFQSLAGKMQQVLQRDESYQILVLETSAAGFDYSQQKQIQTKLKSVFVALNQVWNEQYELQMTGVPVFTVATQALIEGDIIKVSILSSVALTVLFFWLFRSFSALFQVTAILLTVITFSILITMLVFGYIHAMTLAIGTTLIGICIDYPIHALVHTQAVAAEQRIPVIANIWPSMMMGGITTMVGYVALGLSGYPGFQQISVYAGSGILVSLLLTRYVLPALINKSPDKTLNIAAVIGWARFCARYRRKLIVGLLVLLGFALSGLHSLRWISDLQQLTPELSYLQSNDQAIRSRMISSIEPGRFILVSGSDIESALQKAEQVYLVLDQLKEQDELNDYFGLYPWLLSKSQQQRNDAMLRDKLTPEVQAEWKSALLNQGLASDRLGTLDYATTTPLSLQTVMATPIRRLLDSQIIIDAERALLMIWIAKHNPEAVRNAVERIDDVQYFSQRDMVNRLAANYRQRAQTMLIAGVSIILLLLLIRYRNVKKTLLTLLPAVLAAFFILGGWSLSGVAVSFMHLVGFLLAIAICVDYGIFYQENCSGNIRMTYQAMAASMLTSALAFGGLAIANTSSLQTLAIVVAIGVILGFLLCPVIIRQPAK